MSAGRHISSEPAGPGTGISAGAVGSPPPASSSSPPVPPSTSLPPTGGHTPLVSVGGGKGGEREGEKRDGGEGTGRESKGREWEGEKREGRGRGDMEGEGAQIISLPITHLNNYWNAGHWRVSLSEVHMYARAGHARSSCIHMIVIRM